MSIKILDWVEWSDPITKQEDYSILQIEHWQRSDIAPEIDQLRLILAPYNLQNIKQEQYWVLYTPALSSLNGLYEFPNEIDDCWLVKCRLSSIACQPRTMYVDQKFWHEAKVDSVLKLTEFDRFIKPESFDIRNHSDYIQKFKDCPDYSRPQFFQYDCWLWVLFNDQSYAGLDILFRCSDSDLTLVYFSEWIDEQEIKSIVTNHHLKQEDIDTVNDWKTKALQIYQHPTNKVNKDSSS